MDLSNNCQKKIFSQTKIRNTGLFSQTNLKTYLGEQNFKEDYPIYVKEELQNTMNWFETNKMVINISKTKFNVFRPRGKAIEPNVGRLVFNNNELGKPTDPNLISQIDRIHYEGQEKHFKLFGVLFDNFLSFKAHISLL